MNIFNRIESNVRSYCRDYPTVFSSATGSMLFDDQGRSYIDFLSGGGALNYGHNDPCMKRAVSDYLASDGLIHGLDLHSVAKADFLEAFETLVLQPRQLEYKIQFTGPTGSNGIEAALKLARLVKQRANVISFTNGFHGLSLGALAVTGNSAYRNEAFTVRQDVSFLPFDGYLGPDVDTFAYLEKVLTDPGSGVDSPAAVLVETVQAEGGVNVASLGWLKALAALCKAQDILLIVDEIQTGVGRTGPFFSFEAAGLSPDIIVLSKSISGLGLPLTMVLMKPELDQWQPGEHSGTFRGNNLALVAATAALRTYWQDASLVKLTESNGRLVEEQLNRMMSNRPDQIVAVRGRGMLYGVQLDQRVDVSAVLRHCCRNGLVVETCGPRNDVLKIAPPLTTSEELLVKGFSLLEDALGNLEH
jgi:diaminobutyrate-2-oxoglutarate transaminase